MTFRKSPFVRFCIVGVTLIIARPAIAQNPFLHPLFQSNMVLQRDMQDPVWGWTTPGEVVTVTLDGTAVGSGTAGADGKWVALVGPYPNDYGVPHTLSVSSASQGTVTGTNVVFGDVYLSAGQSNCNFRLNAVLNASSEGIIANNYPLIRTFYSASYPTPSATPSDLPVAGSSWVIGSAKNAGAFTAVGYFFARNIHQQTGINHQGKGIPIGLMKAAYDGRKIEEFLMPAGLGAVPEVSALLQNAPNNSLYYDLYNVMVAPFVPYGLRGVVWYQGEANSGEGNDTYHQKLRALIAGLRAVWGQGNFPFYIVQLPNFTDPNFTYPEVRESQLNTLSEPNTGLAVTIDTAGGTTNLHPLDKQDVGYRMSLWALGNDLAKDYGRPIVYSGPLFNAATVEGSQIRVAFTNVGNGLMSGTKGTYIQSSTLSQTIPPVQQVSGSIPLQNFEISGTNEVFVPATATIDGPTSTVIVSSTSVPNPAYVRYAFSQDPGSTSIDLYNTDGLPASPFRTDPHYALVVMGGRGSTGGSSPALPGARIVISASAAPAGQVFDRWIGAASGIDNINSGTTTITMPAHAVFLLASYRSSASPVYNITAGSAYGSGSSQPGSYLNVEALPAPTWYVFDKWVGNTDSMADVHASSTTLVMPSTNISITATYRLKDSVGDGIPDQWRATYFGGDGTTSNNQSNATADPDGDGMTNLQEYLAGTNPVDSASFFHVVSVANSGTGYAVSWASIAGKTYQVQYSASPGGPWLETLPSSQVTAGGTQNVMTYTDMTAGGASKRFYKIRLVVP